MNIALVGMPNSGKSTFFNGITGSHSPVANWPGLTVELHQASIQLQGKSYQLIDLPGIYDLHGLSEDEAIVRRFLESTPLHLLVLILNASQIDRQLRLALQVQQLDIQTLVLLNMGDEAQRFGIQINTKVLSEQLAMPVCLISAKYKAGFQAVELAMVEATSNSSAPRRVEHLEARLKVEEKDLERRLAQLLNQAVDLPEHLRDQLTSRLDRFLLDPLLGLPLFFLVMFLMFQAIYALGGPLQLLLGQLLDSFSHAVLMPLLAGAPAFLRGFLLEGLYQGIGTVAAFLPVIFLFFLAMAVVEDSGYLSRAAFLMDGLMERLGLDGRSFVLSLMGFGCNVPAILGTRVMRSKGLRILTMLVIPFSLCSARLNVFLFMSAALFAPSQGATVVFSLYLISFLAAILTALIFKGQFPSSEPLLLELPPYRFPTFKQMLLRSWAEVRHFWFWSRKFIIFGVMAVWLLNNLPLGVASASEQSLSGMLGTALQPLLQPIGINPKLTVALVFGFIAKEIVLGGLAVIYNQSDMGHLSHALALDISSTQAYSFMLFTLLYTPCLSTVAVIRSESKRWGITWLSVFWSLLLAWLASFIFYQGSRLMGFS
jgi:ferrous iron transport protein B